MKCIVFIILFLFSTSCVVVEYNKVIDNNNKEIEDYQDNLESHTEFREIESPEIEGDTLEFDVHKQVKSPH